MVAVARLGYIGWNVTNIRAWDDLLQTVYGLELRTDSLRGSRQYRLDDHHHRVSIYSSKTDEVRFIGWEVDSLDDLEAMKTKLADNGVKVERGSKAEINERAVMDMIRCEDPDGFKTEIFYTGILDNTPFRPSRGMAGFNTGHMGLGHIVLHSKDKPKAMDFYEGLLGFKLSDYIHWPDADGAMAEGTFMHCNSRHHSIALMNEAFGAKGGDFNHLLFEAKSLDDVGRAYDIVQEKGYPLCLSLGRHTNDQMTSFYLFTPSGWVIEYGYGAVLVDDATWEPKYYDAPKLWGHNAFAPPEKWPIAV